MVDPFESAVISQWPAAVIHVTYKLDLALAALLDAERKRLFKTRLGFMQCQECLMWSFRGCSICRGEDNLESVACTQCYVFAQRRGSREPTII